MNEYRNRQKRRSQGNFNQNEKIYSLDSYRENYYYDQTERLQKKSISSYDNVKNGTITKGGMDIILLFVVIMLLIFGVIMIFSASYYKAMTDSNINNMFFFFRKQSIVAIIGTIGMLVVSNFKYTGFKKLSKLIYIGAIILLLSLFVVGQARNNSTRWLDIMGISFQPSEFAKVAMFLYLPAYIIQNKESLYTFKGFFRCLIVIGIPFVVVALSNLSSALIIAFIGAAILFLAAPKLKFFLPFIGLGGVALVPLLYFFSYRLDRIKSWLDPFSDAGDTGFQVVQSLYAVASGGLFGMGLGQSRQKTYIPEVYNDIIFSVICEELGLVGALIVITLFAVLIWRGIKIAMKAPDTYGCLVASGITAMIGIQAIMNIAVATNSMPNTGVSLPFISYGGSSLLFTLGSMGILLNISRYQRE